MIRTIEAIIDENGEVHRLEPIPLSGTGRALVIILEEPRDVSMEPALLSEPALAEDWNRPEEDKAWSYLQEDRYYAGKKVGQAFRPDVSGMSGRKA